MATAAVSGWAPGTEPSLPDGLSLTLREALFQVLENRPEDPVSFLGEYFQRLVESAREGAAEKSAPRPKEEQVSCALKQLLLSHYSRPAFSRNTALAFHILSCPANKRKKPGLKGRIYTELLRQICGGAGISSCSLIRKLQCWDHEAVPFSVFRHGVLTCFIFLDFVKISRRLFEVVAESGEASRTVCQALLDALQDALNVSKSASGPGCLDAALKLSPNQLGQTMEQAMRLRKNETSPPMTQEEFTMLTAPFFIQRVKPMC
ncbi:tubulin polyglutamylase complex subunit 1 [Narcine bancroftii]|uniref:tubulin polyglutamylase complex subunit 1 n=1 Tax=Narcine bancroftii TaxID=1343680 RepID=UPI003831F832